MIRSIYTEGQGWEKGAASRWELPPGPLSLPGDAAGLGQGLPKTRIGIFNIAFSG